MGALPLQGLYIGCYTEMARAGIHTVVVGADGVLTTHATCDEARDASYVAVCNATGTVYAVRETAPVGAVVAFRADDGHLTKIDEVSSLGAAPCHVSVADDRLFVANYVSGSVASYALQPDGTFGGLIGEHQHAGNGPHLRQDGPHAHCVTPGPTPRSVYAVDLGTDQVLHYGSADETEPFALIGTTAMPSGSGPRHLAFHPTLPLAFIVCELSCTLVVADVDLTSGRLDIRDSMSVIPGDDVDDSLAAAIAVHPDGQRMYVSTRGHDNIATFAIRADGSPELVEHVSSGGRSPRDISIDASGNLLLVANQHSNAVMSFTLDDSGVPRPAATMTGISQPVCITRAEPTP